MEDNLRYRVSDRLILIQLEGEYTIDRLLELTGAALADPATPDRVLLLIDARKSTVERSTGEIRRTATAFSGWAPRIERMAIVVGSEVHYGLTRMASILSEESGLIASPFRDLAEARRFLGVES